MGMSLSQGAPGRYAVRQNSEINVTPFVDVMLVLLIIFMVSIPASTREIKLQLPKAQAQPPDAPVVEPTVVIIQPGGLFVGDQPTTIATLPRDVALALNVPDPTHQRVYVRAARGVRYGEFMAVMNTLQGNGFFQVALINEEL